MILRRLLNSPTAAGGGIGVPDTLSWRDVFLRSGSHAGKTVTPETSMAVPAVWGAMRILTDSIGSMPLITYERTAGNGRAGHGTFSGAIGGTHVKSHACETSPSFPCASTAATAIEYGTLGVMPTVRLNAGPGPKFVPLGGVNCSSSN